jgi:hypothetical protein
LARCWGAEDIKGKVLVTIKGFATGRGDAGEGLTGGTTLGGGTGAGTTGGAGTLGGATGGAGGVMARPRISATLANALRMGGPKDKGSIR